MAKFAQKFRVEVTVPEGLQAGDTFMIEVETPEVATKQRVINTKPIEEMTDEELKREIINANSVYYKASKKTDDESILAPKRARLEAAKAERDKRVVAAGGVATSGGAPIVVTGNYVDPNAEAEQQVAADDESTEGQDVYADAEGAGTDEGLAGEI